MGTENLKVSKGDTIVLKGQYYKMAAQAKIRVNKTTDNTLSEDLGEAKSDTNDDRIKRAVCRIIENRIRALEEKENDSLFDIREDDVLFAFDEIGEAPQALISNHVGATNTILDLKKILKEIKAL